MEYTRIKKVTIISSITNIFLAIIKVIIGIITKSQSLIADGIHSLSDLVTDFAVFFGVNFWSKEPDDEHPYGHGRIETFVTMLIGFSLLFVAAIMTYKAIHSIINYTQTSPRWITFYIAIISILTKEILFRYSLKQSYAIKSKALEANSWHHRSDALSSIPVALSIIVAKVFPTIQYTDQIATILVSIFLVKAAFSIIIGCIDELMEKEDTAIDILPVLDDNKKKHNDIKDFHKIHIRRVGSSIYIDLHLLVTKDISVNKSHTLAGIVKQAIMQSNSQVKGVIIHIEPYL